jgi:uncharacterized membrane protein
MTPGSGQRVSDERVEMFLGNLLRWGVIFAATIVLAGTVLHLWQHGEDRAAEMRVFRKEPPDLCSIRGIFVDARSLKSTGIIQLGLLALVATPIARVVFSIIAFALQRDLTYVVFTILVLGILLYSLAGGFVH